MKEVTYRRRTDGVCEIVRPPTRLRRIAVACGLTLGAVCVLLATAAAMVLYTALGIALLVLVCACVYVLSRDVRRGMAALRRASQQRAQGDAAAPPRPSLALVRDDATRRDTGA
jgi:hypothetical protein